jgi:3-oxoacyl-[acyl-carrier-protein] synthase-3
VSDSTVIRGSAAPAAARGQSPHGAAVAGLGTAIPTIVVDNATVAEQIGKDVEWIVSRTGIHERRVLGPGEQLAPLATQAAQAALDDAGMSAGEIDMVIVATCSPDDLLPATAVTVAGLLGAGRAVGLDVNAACTGFLSGLQLGSSVLEAGRAEAVLVIGAEHLSKLIDPTDKQTAMLFADGAGATVLTRTTGPGELGPVVLRSEPQRDFLYASHADCTVRMQGQEVFKHAVARMSEATQQAVAAAQTTLDEIDLFVYHQANSRIVASVGRRLGLDPERVVDCIAGYGNVSAASLPIALAYARDEGRLPDGARVLVSAFGAGFVWGAAVLDWRATA